MLRRHACHSRSYTRSHSTRGIAQSTWSQTAHSHTPSTLPDVKAEQSHSSEQQHYAEELISSLPLIRHLRASSFMTESSPGTNYEEFRLHSNKNPDTFARHLVAGSLFGNQKLPIYPRLFIQRTPVPRIIAACYIGDHLCGHPGYVHGGLPFVLFDDIFALCAGMGFESGVAMTANMNINFRKPFLPERLCIIRAEVVRQQGRKAWVEGSVRSLDVFTAKDMEKVSMANNSGISAEEANATVVAETTSVFVEPKFAHVGCLYLV